MNTVIACMVCARPFDAVLASALHAGVAVMAAVALAVIAVLVRGVIRLLREDRAALAAVNHSSGQSFSSAGIVGRSFSSAGNVGRSFSSAGNVGQHFSSACKGRELPSIEPTKAPGGSRAGG